MAELLFWNTLTESAKWLSETLGEQVTPKSLIQKILDRAEPAGRPFPPTIIKALLPRDVRLASVWILPRKSDIGEVDRRIHERMTEVFGESPIKGTLYTGDISTKAIPLYPAQIADLISHGNIEVSLLHENQLSGYAFRDGEYGYILPIGTKHIATLETCGTNRDDLLALANQFSNEAKINKPKDPRESLVQVDKSAFRKLCPADDYKNYGGFRVQDDGLHLTDSLEAAIDKGEVDGDSKEILNDYSGHALKFPCSLTELRAFLENAGLHGSIDEDAVDELLANLSDENPPSTSDAGQAAAEPLQAQANSEDYEPNAMELIGQKGRQAKNSKRLSHINATNHLGDDEKNIKFASLEEAQASIVLRYVALQADARLNNNDAVLAELHRLIGCDTLGNSIYSLNSLKSNITKWRLKT